MCEVVIKAALGRLSLDDPFESHVAAAGFEPLAITFAHAAEVGLLPIFTPIRSTACSSRRRESKASRS